MKLTGAIIIIYACWMLGVDLYKSNIKRLNFTKGLFSCAEFLKTEIVYDCVFLEDSIIRSVPFSGDAASFIECIGTRLEEKGISTEAAFEKAKPDLIKNVSSEVYLLTKELFFQLGEKDCESQEKLISGYLKKLEPIIEKQDGFCRKECVMFKKTGAIVGIGIAVLLI